MFLFIKISLVMASPHINRTVIEQKLVPRTGDIASPLCLLKEYGRLWNFRLEMYSNTSVMFTEPNE